MTDSRVARLSRQEKEIEWQWGAIASRKTWRYGKVSDSNGMLADERGSVAGDGRCRHRRVTRDKSEASRRSRR